MKWKSRIPNILSYSRIAMIPPLLLISYFKLQTIFLTVYTLTILTDCLDGYLARRWNVVSEGGAAADAIPDVVLGIASIPMLYLLFPEVILEYLWGILGVAAYVVVARISTSIKQGLPTGMHLWSGKITMALLMVTVLVSAYLGRPNATIPLFIIVAAITSTEELLINIFYNNVHVDTPNIFRIRYRDD